MTTIDWAALSRLIPEALMVLIVLGYVWQRGKLQDAKDERRDTMFLTSAAERDKTYTRAMSDRDREWREFMSAERTRQAEGLARLTESVAVLAHDLTAFGSLVTATNQLISMHDKWEREELDRRLPMKPKTGPFHPHEES